MNVQDAYNLWADQYDTNFNKTRDVEAFSLKKTLGKLHFNSCLEIGCGTGKNTQWLLTKANNITAVDFSSEMLVKAKQKITSGKVNFKQADITGDWNFATQKFDLITFSLVLEHIKNLDHIFKQAAGAIANSGCLYIGELHPFKQYAGSKAKFEKGSSVHVLDCFTHNVSEFTQTAKQHGFEIMDLNEYFDDDDKTVPRILTLLFRKQ